MLYSFDRFELDDERFEIRRDGLPLSCEPQVIELLLLLLKNRERLISKEEINQSVWKGRIVSEAALSSRIKSLRQLLGDSGKSQKFIQTVHKKGFRFIATVNSAREDESLGQRADRPEAESGISRPKIAVLPFRNLGTVEDSDYFSEGISSDIISHLAKHHWLSVIARNTTFGFRDSYVNAQALGRELDADYLIEGSVQRSGNRIRVNVNLVETTNGFNLRSDRYDREINDLFTLQDEITEKITGRLEPEIGFAERKKVVLNRPSSLQAWDCYHLGIYKFYQFTPESNLKAQDFLKQSQQLDPHFPEPFAWWAYSMVLGMVYWGTEPEAALLDEALQACDRALRLDPENASFYALRARVLLARCEYASAIAENEAAISLNPTFAAAYCGLADSLAYEGRYDESVQYFEKAIDLSPNDPQLWAFYSYGALMFLFKKEFSKALEWSRKATLIPNCQYWAYAHQAVALVYLGLEDESRQALDRVRLQVPEFDSEFARRKLFYLRRPEQIELYIQGLQKAEGIQ